MIVMCDMGPLHYLVLMGVEHILPWLFTRVLTPAAVLVEMMRPKAPEPVRRCVLTSLRRTDFLRRF